MKTKIQSPPNKSSPPVRRSLPPPPINQQSTQRVTFMDSEAVRGQRVVIYGTGGIEKTTLACMAPGPVGMFDFDESLFVLRPKLKTLGIPFPKIIKAPGWAETRTALQSSGWDDIKSIVIDTGTRLEMLCMAWMLKNVKHEKGHLCQQLEDYGFGKGYQHLFETFAYVLGDLDRHVRQGRNVFLVCHDCTANVPNPMGEDYLRYEPRLQNPNSGKASIRSLVKEWADHVCFMGYDVVVEKDSKKAQGHGSKTLYTQELPYCMAKSRTTDKQFLLQSPITEMNPWPEIIMS